MARETRMRPREENHPKPVEKVELSEKHVGLRFAAVIVLAVIAAVAIGFGVAGIFGVEGGWQEIEVSAAGLHCGEEFTLVYCLGTGEQSAATEKRGVTLAYSAAAERGYQLFSSEEEFEDVKNLYWLNAHPNEETEVDEGLYLAFSRIVASGDRSVYLGPAHQWYDGLFDCQDDSQALDYDPLKNADLREDFAQAAAWACDKDAVDVELLGEGRVRLKVSEEYLDWAQENGLDRFLDLSWMKNGFLADYLADALLDGGYTRGCISSVDGFVRNLDESGESYSLSVYDRTGGRALPAAMMDYTGPVAAVCLHDFPLAEKDQLYYYRYGDGSMRGRTLSPQDGLYRAAVPNLICYSGEKTCGELLLAATPLYLADQLDEKALAALEGEGISSIWCAEEEVRYTGEDVKLRDLYQGGGLSYSLTPVGSTPVG